MGININGKKSKLNPKPVLFPKTFAKLKIHKIKTTRFKIGTNISNKNH
jgi:hypothetical protein